MEVPNHYRPKIAYILCLAATCQASPLGIKKACIVSFITTASYMLYNDYRYTIASYRAYKNERALDRLLDDLTQNTKRESPHPTWWLDQYHQLIQLKKSAIEYQNKALLSRLLNFLYNRCKHPKHFN